jgi:hypothetical protein
MAFQYAGQFNAFVPKVTGQVIGNARDPKKYKINRYTQLIKAPAPLGVYYKVHNDDFVRQVADKERTWEDGAKRPEVTGNRVRHDTAEFQTIRKDYDFQIGWRTLARRRLQRAAGQHPRAENEAMIAWTQDAITAPGDGRQLGHGQHRRRRRPGRRRPLGRRHPRGPGHQAVAAPAGRENLRSRPTAWSATSRTRRTWA